MLGTCIYSAVQWLDLPVSLVPDSHLITDAVLRLLAVGGAHQSIKQCVDDEGTQLPWCAQRMLCLLHHGQELVGGGAVILQRRESHVSTTLSGYKTRGPSGSQIATWLPYRAVPAVRGGVALHGP